MRKWAFLYSAAALAVIGCGGSGNGSHATNTTGGGTTGNTATVAIKLSNLSTSAPGSIAVAFLTGQGRAVGDLSATVQQLRFYDQYGEVTNPLGPQISCPLTGFQNNIVYVSVPFSGQPSRSFSTFNLDFLNFHEETDSPVMGDFSVLQEPAALPKGYPASVRTFPGRVTSLPVFIDDSMFTVDTVNPLLVDYNESQFLLANGATSANPMKGFLSDFVAFNLSGYTNTALLPTLAATTGIAGGTTAVRVFFSGDVYAIADGFTSGANFEALTLDPTLPIGGVLGSAGTITTGPTGSLPHAGTYSLLQLNPTDLTQTLKVVAGQGIWREHKTVLRQSNGAALGAGSYVITFPSSNDNNMQEMVAFTQDANANISALYFGFIDLDALTFNLYPIGDIVSGSTAGGIDGTLGQLNDRYGHATTSPDLVHSGAFAFNSSDGSSAAATQVGFKNGTFYVFRL